MPAFPASELLASAMASVNQTGSAQIASADWYIFLDEEYRILRRRIGKVCPAFVSKLMAFTVSSGSTWTISVTDNDFADVDRLERLIGAQYVELEASDFRLISAGTLIEFLSCYQASTSIAAAGSYRLHYLPRVTTRINDAADTLTLPDGADVIVSLLAGARAADTLDDPLLASSCRKRAETLFKDLRMDLMNMYGRTRRTRRDITGRHR